MLIEIPSHTPDPVYALLAGLDGKSAQVETERVGIYRIGHFGGSSFMRGMEHYPDFDSIPVSDGMPARMKEEAWEGCISRNAYGVCDNVEQLLKHFPELEASDRKFVVTLSEVRKDEQPPSGGWRWHKWGPYIGNHDCQYEYLYDEVGIEAVLVYHIYELIDYDAMTTEQLKERYKEKYYREFNSESCDWRGDSEGAVRAALLHVFKHE